MTIVGTCTASKNYKLSRHLVRDRQARLNVANNIGFGQIADSFLIESDNCDRTIHIVTDTGLVLIETAKTHVIKTILIARGRQIKKYYEAIGKKAPGHIVHLAYKHEQAGYNKV